MRAYKCIAAVNIYMVNVANDAEMSYVLRGFWTPHFSDIGVRFDRCQSFFLVIRD